jgi:hypothetical protein
MGHERSITTLTSLAAVVAVTACSGSNGTGATGTSGGGATAPASVSCVYQQQDVTYCDGNDISDPPKTICRDLPCSQLSFDPGDAVVAGDCNGYTQYASQHDFDGSCADWTAAGSPLTGVCAPVGASSFVATWHPPATSKGACTQDDIAAFAEACKSDLATCKAFEQDPARSACAACIFTPSIQPDWGPVVSFGPVLMPNVGGCIALLDPTELDCARWFQTIVECPAASCASCPAQASQADLDACATAALNGGGCATPNLPVTCGPNVLMSGAGSTCNSSLASLAAAFCGP